MQVLGKTEDADEPAPGAAEESPSEMTAVPVRTVRPYTTVICTPGVYSDARRAADALEKGKMVMLRLQETDGDTAARIIDFVSGVVYMLRGSIEMFDERTFLCVPDSVRIVKDDFRFHADGLFQWKGIPT